MLGSLERTTDGNPAPVPHPPNVNVIGLCICQAQIETKESDLTQKLECFATGENPYYVTLVGNPTSPGIFQFYVIILRRALGAVTASYLSTSLI